MKNIQKILAVIGMMAVLFATNLSFADGGGGGSGGGNTSDCNPVVPDRLPLSISDMWTSAIKRIAQVGVWGWAESSIRGSTNVHSSVWLQYQPTNGVVDIRQVVGIIKTQSMVLNVLYPSTSLQLQTGLFDSNSQELFYGFSMAPINPPNHGVSSNRLSIVLELSDNLVIPFSGATRYYIVERDENGNPIRYYDSRQWDVQNGWMRIPGYFLDKRGEVVVSLCNGLEVAYSLNNRGKRIIPTVVQADIGDVTMLGSRTFQNNTNVVFVEVSAEESARNINPRGQLYHSVGGKVTFVAWRSVNGTIEFANAIKWWGYDQSPTSLHRAPIDHNSDTGSEVFMDGVAKLYFFEFEWPSSWPNNQNQFFPPYEYYGGGSVTPTIPSTP